MSRVKITEEERSAKALRFVEFLKIIKKNVTEFAELVELRYDQVYRWSKGISVPDINLLKDYGMNPVYFETGEGDILNNEYNESALVVSNNKGVPYYGIDVTASIAESFNDIQEVPEFYIDFKPLNDCSAYFPVYGDSMFPKYCSGEIVAVKQLNNFDTLLWGEAYLIITDSMANNLKTIKLIHQHQDIEKVILKSSNPNFNGETVVYKKNILNIFIIKGKITRTML